MSSHLEKVKCCLPLDLETYTSDLFLLSRHAGGVLYAMHAKLFLCFCIETDVENTFFAEDFAIFLLMYHRIVLGIFFSKIRDFCVN